MPPSAKKRRQPGAGAAAPRGFRTLFCGTLSSREVANGRFWAYSQGSPQQSKAPRLLELQQSWRCIGVLSSAQTASRFDNLFLQTCRTAAGGFTPQSLPGDGSSDQQQEGCLMVFSPRNMPDLVAVRVAVRGPIISARISSAPRIPDPKSREKSGCFSRSIQASIIPFHHPRRVVGNHSHP